MDRRAIVTKLLEIKLWNNISEQMVKLQLTLQIDLTLRTI